MVDEIETEVGKYGERLYITVCDTLSIFSYDGGRPNYGFNTMPTVVMKFK